MGFVARKELCVMLHTLCCSPRKILERNLKKFSRRFSKFWLLIIEFVCTSCGQIYQEAFETRFLESTAELYHAEGQMLIQEWEVSLYNRLVNLDNITVNSKYYAQSAKFPVHFSL